MEGVQSLHCANDKSCVCYGINLLFQFCIMLSGHVGLLKTKVTVLRDCINRCDLKPAALFQGSECTYGITMCFILK